MEQNYNPLTNQRDAVDFMRTLGHLNNQDAQRKLTEEQIRLQQEQLRMQRETLELEKQKLAQEQEKIKLEREQLARQQRGQQLVSPTPFQQPTSPSFPDDSTLGQTSFGKRMNDFAAIRNEPNQARKQRMLSAFEAKYGVVSNRDKSTLGLTGY
jgi:hypothetical protein